jgi:hypothetical protein
MTAACGYEGFPQGLAPLRTGNTTTTGGKAMTGRNDQLTSFTYTTYIHATPERVWQGLTDSTVTKRYWRHHRAGAKTFRSDWKKGSTYELPPAGLHLAHHHARVGRQRRHGRSHRARLAR